jgi:hypothetical protein
MKVLFLLKRRAEYYDPNLDPRDLTPKTGWGRTTWTGLRNSVAFVVDMLKELGIDAHFERVHDDNSIDKAVHHHKPTHAIIEALWVRPSKLAQLTKLHPKIHWDIRLHSELPFIALESISMEYLFGYLKSPRVTISANSKRAVEDFERVFNVEVPYTPNYYPLYPFEPKLPGRRIIDVGCFGAIRPLKNQFAQAVAAVSWANEMGRVIRFHINSDRIEMGGAPVLQNLRAFFANIKPHTLVEHPWLERASFMALVRTMNMGMQVSFSETFNIVAADFAVLNIPLVVSPEISWAAPSIMADPTSAADMIAKLRVAWAGRNGGLQRMSYEGLREYDAKSEIAWPIALQEMK